MANCILCKSDRLKTLYRLTMLPVNEGTPWKMTVSKCRACGLVFLDPSTALSSARAFNEQWWDEIWGPVYTSREADVRASAIERCGWLETRFPERGRLLDVGCGEGTFLDVAQDRGWDVGGIEVADAAVRRASDKIGGGKVFTSLDQAGFPDASFDVATLWDVIEHVPDPPQLLKDLTRLLRPGGALVLSTPNVQSLLHKIAHISYRGTFSLCGFAVRRIYFPGHLYYFDMATLKRALSGAGLGAPESHTDLKAPGGVFDDLDALFSANKGEGWTRLPLMKPMIKSLIASTRAVGQPYRFLIISRKA